MALEGLISSIVRQTTVLIARLSTTGGARSPLSQVADQIFMGLVTELERQGVGKKVAADMFGLALRSYQLKVQRLQESASETGVTLWSAVRAFVEEQGSVSREEIVQRFKADEETNVRGILADLVESGLCSRTGRGDSTLYRVTPAADLTRLAQAPSSEAALSLVWLVVCRDGPLGREALAAATGLTPAELESALEALCLDSRITRHESDSEPTWSAERCLIPVGDRAGWEAALLDHHQTVLNAMAAKVTTGSHSSAQEDETGGATYGFELWPGHPEEATVRGLLLRFRTEAARLWERVSEYNAQAKHADAERYHVSFYLGQHLKRDDRFDEES
jgi:hypothetical protein